MENGLYLFRFVDEKTRDEVLEAKLWHIANKPLILRRWTPGMQLLKLSVFSIPVWIKLHNLPMKYWTATCLSHVASGVGKPLCADSVTEEQLRLGFARVLVEVNVDSDFPKEIEIAGSDGIPVIVGIEYPWIPVKCNKCKLFGHAAHACTKVEKVVWIPRRPAPIQKDLVKQVLATQEKTVGPSVAVNSGVQPWTVVRSHKKTPASKPPVSGSNSKWANSFHLLARVDDMNCQEGEVHRFSKSALGVESALDIPKSLDKGKGILGDDVEILMRGFSPTI